jgi:hypothetical protein
MNKPAIVLILVLIIFSGTACNQIIDRVFSPPSKTSEFEYYDESFQLSDSSDLNTESFYYTQGEGVSGSYYAYLKFHPDGACEYFGGTALTPDSVDYYQFLETERKKRSGLPKDRKADWGYYTTSNDSIKLTFKKHRAMSSIMHKYLGVIEDNSITFKTYSYSVLDSSYRYESDEIYELYE